MPTAPVERWTLLTEDDQRFGPVPRAELDRWYADGRITAQCQLLREGASAWQWATEIYPSLAAAAASSGPVDLFAGMDTGSPAAPINPYQFEATPVPVSSRVTGTTKGSRGRRSPAIGYASMACTVVGITYIAYGLIYVLFSAVFVASMAGRFSARAATSAAIQGTIVGVIVLVVGAFLSIPYFVAALGISKRQAWGKIVGFVTGASQR